MAVAAGHVTCLLGIAIAKSAFSRGGVRIWVFRGCFGLYSTWRSARIGWECCWVAYWWSKAGFPERESQAAA